LTVALQVTGTAPVQIPAYRQGVLRFVGNTPLVRIEGVTDHLPASVEVYAKLEYFNPGGSVKDRAAYHMIVDALESGALRRGQTLIDATSGNTGVAYAMIGAALGIRVELVMPANVSKARKALSRAYGAKITYSSPMEGSDGAIRLVREMVANDVAGKYYYPDQYRNPSNPRAHYLTTGPEIWQQTGGRVTHFVCGIGTSGTVMGTTARLKEYDPRIYCAGIEPDDAFHGLEGLKHLESSIVPDIYDPARLDETLRVGTDEAWDMQDRLAREDGIAVGHSGGAAMVGALQVAERLSQGVVVTLVPDHRERYIAGHSP
jgi:cysteine synthase B